VRPVAAGATVNRALRGGLGRAEVAAAGFGVFGLEPR
jgi:hypothetical protein